MIVLLCKLLLAPGFVVAITLAVRRFGPRVGGILGGLPVVAGPILFIYAIDHGTRFASTAGASSVAGLVALTAFVMTLVAASTRFGALLSLLLGWVAFCAVAGVVTAIEPPPVIGLVASSLSFALGLRFVPHSEPEAVNAVPKRPPFDLAIRAGVTAAMVLALTSVSGALGPVASGAFSMFPTITSVLAGFAIAHETRATTLHLVRGMLRGYFSFVAALFVIAVTLEPWGIVPSFLAAIVATALVQLVLIATVQRPALVPEPSTA